MRSRIAPTTKNLSARDRAQISFARTSSSTVRHRSSSGTKLYIALSDSDQVAIIDIAQRKLTGVIDDVVAQPWAVNAAGGLSYCH
jgi:YVTN family beta-propeller protein